MKRIPEIDGLRIDEAHKGGGIGGFIKKAVKSVGDVTLDAVTLGQSDTIKGVAKGITGIAAAEAAKDAADAAKKEAAKQDALVAAQDAEIERKRRLAQNVADERKTRMSQNQLLSGSETGTTGSTNLLGA